MNEDRFLPVMVVAGVVAIVAIVSLFLWSGRIEGAHSSNIFSHLDEEVEGCIDTDPKNDFYTAGNVTKAFTQYRDYCLNGGSLFQHYCDEHDYVKLSVYHNCPKGCLNGVCIK